MNIKPMDSGNCSTLVFGKNASETGHVMIAHNEDDSDSVVQLLRIPREKHAPDEILTFPDGSARIPEVSETLSYYLSEIRTPKGASFADSFVNECGVAIFSDRALPCKLPRIPEENGIAYGLRKIVASRAKSAREGMRILADMVEKYGYSSARIYHIADKDECWICQVTTGHRLVAQRLPDDHVYYVANWYTIHHINFDDHENFYCSPDLVSFAIENGWYTPAMEGCFDDFDFAEVYYAPDTENQLYNEYRTRSAWPALGFERDLERPFSYRAKRKYGLNDAKALLRDHGEAAGYANHTRFERDPHQNSPSPCSICNVKTAESMIVEFDEDPALTIIWRAQQEPCTNPYVPIYLGARDLPESYSFYDADLSEKTHFSTLPSEFCYNPQYTYWAFKNLIWMTHLDYGFCHAILEGEIKKLEDTWGNEQAGIKQTYKAINDLELGARYLSAYTKQRETDAHMWALSMTQKIGEEKVRANIASSLENVPGHISSV